MREYMYDNAKIIKYMKESKLETVIKETANIFELITIPINPCVIALTKKDRLLSTKLIITN